MSRFFESRRGRRSGFDNVASVVGQLLSVGQQVEGFVGRRRAQKEHEVDRERDQFDRAETYRRQKELDTINADERERQHGFRTAAERRAEQDQTSQHREQYGEERAPVAAKQRGDRVELQAKVGHNLSSIRALGNDAEFNQYSDLARTEPLAFVKTGKSASERNQYSDDLRFETQRADRERERTHAEQLRAAEQSRKPWEKDGFATEREYLDHKRRETGATQRASTSDPAATSQRTAIRQAIQSATREYTRGQSDGVGGLTGRLTPAEAARQARADAVEVHGEDAVRDAVGGAPARPAPTMAVPARGGGGRGSVVPQERREPEGVSRNSSAAASKLPAITDADRERAKTDPKFAAWLRSQGLIK